MPTLVACLRRHVEAMQPRRVPTRFGPATRLRRPKGQRNQGPLATSQAEMWSSRRLRDGGGASGRVEHPAAQQAEPGAAVHGALDRLEAADLALDGTRRPRRLERGPD